MNLWICQKKKTTGIPLETCKLKLKFLSQLEDSLYNGSGILQQRNSLCLAWLPLNFIFEYFFCTGCHRAKFWKIDIGVQALPLSVHKMAPMRAFSIFQKWPKMAKITPDDLLTMKMVLIEPPRKTEQDTLLVL